MYNFTDERMWGLDVLQYISVRICMTVMENCIYDIIEKKKQFFLYVRVYVINSYMWPAPLCNILIAN